MQTIRHLWKTKTFYIIALFALRPPLLSHSDHSSRAVEFHNNIYNKLLGSITCKKSVPQSISQNAARTKIGIMSCEEIKIKRSDFLGMYYTTSILVTEGHCIMEIDLIHTVAEIALLFEFLEKQQHYKSYSISL